MRSAAIVEEACVLVTDGTHYTPANAGVGIPFLTVKDVTDAALDFTDCSFITDEDFRAAKAGNSAPQRGDVLFSKDGTVGKVHVVATDQPFAVLSSLAILRPRHEIVDSAYLGHALRSPTVLDDALRRKTGSAIRRIVLSDLKQVRLPIPSLEEQRRVAGVLDRSEALRAKRRSTIEQLDSLARAIFLDMFGDPAVNPMRWPLKPVGEIGQVVTGNTPPRANAGYYGTAIEWAKSDNINSPLHYLTEAHEGLSDAGKAVARTAPAGSILVTCIAGSPDSIGNAAMTEREVAFNQQINAIVPVQGEVHFLYAQILVGKRLIQNASTGSMKGMVSKSRFEQILLTFPPIDLQRAFARRFAAVDNLQAAYRAYLANLDALFAVLQHRAFRGEL